MPFDTTNTPPTPGNDPIHPNDVVPLIFGRAPGPFLMLKPSNNGGFDGIEFSLSDDAAALAAQEGATVLPFDPVEGLYYAVATSAPHPAPTIELTGPKGEHRAIFVLDPPQPHSEQLERFFTGVPLFAPGWTVAAIRADARFTLEELTTPEPGSVADAAEVLSHWNDARVVGCATPEMDAAMERPMTFMLGEMRGEKDRRNTQDGKWREATMPLKAWIEGGPGGKGHSTWGFSRHPVSPEKEGDCWVFGASLDKARKAKAMQTMHCIALDIDSGSELDTVVDRIQALGLFAIIYTSHSHGTSGLSLKRDEVVKKLGTSCGLSTEDIQVYLKSHAKERFSDEFIAQVTVIDEKKQTKDGLKVICSTPPMPRFRIVFPLKNPITLIELADRHDEALRIWEAKTTGLAVEMLKVHFDTSCTDPSRLFFVPKHAKGRPHETVIVQGTPVDFVDIPEVSKIQYARQRTLGATLNPFALAGDDGSKLDIPMVLAPTSGALLNEWHSRYKTRFMLVDLIETLCPDKLRNQGSEGAGRAHLECPFEHNHSADGGTACMAINPDVSDSEVWTIFCHHDSCQGLHKLEFLEQMLKEDWFDEAALTGNAFLLPPADDEIDVAIAAEEARTASGAEGPHSEQTKVMGGTAATKFTSDEVVITAFRSHLRREGSLAEKNALFKEIIAEKLYSKRDLNKLFKTAEVAEAKHKAEINPEAGIRI